MNENWELSAVRNQLKQVLKQKKFGYKRLARELGVSEITIKRFFSSKDFSFVKLQSICQVIGISALDLMAVVKNGSEETFSLTIQQEKYFAENVILYEFFTLLLKFKSVKIVLQKGRFKKEHVPRYLRELNDLDLIELPVGDTVRVKHTGVLTWLRGGYLQKKFMRLRHVKYLEVFEGQMNGGLGYLASSQRQMRAESIEEMKRDLEFIVQKYRARAYREETIYNEDQLVGVAWLVGVGQYSHYSNLGVDLVPEGMGDRS